VSESGDPYVYPGTRTLRNRLGLTDPADLDRVERLYAADRATQPIPRGAFDLTHLRAIHRHLFQDIYDWAGELRTVEISKRDQQFQFRQYIQTGMADVHRRLERSRFLRGLSAADFAAQAAVIIGDINYIHPFREGNGRTQLHYLKQLAEQAGHRLDLARIAGEHWIAASVSSHAADYRPMAEVIAGALKPRG
jgi:cell filamentation protein, protein adenylyltransferase